MILNIGLLLVLLIGCSKTSVKTEDELLLKSDRIFNLLQDLNWVELGEHIHPEKEVVFSIFADVHNKENLLFNKEELQAFTADSPSYIWGYNLEEEPFVWTPNQLILDYFFKHYGQEELDYRIKSYNSSQSPGGGTLNTIPEFYPNGKYVEFYSPAPLSHDLKWQALRFVYEKHEGKWYLSAIVRDVYSP